MNLDETAKAVGRPTEDFLSLEFTRSSFPILDRGFDSTTEADDVAPGRRADAAAAAAAVALTAALSPSLPEADWAPAEASSFFLDVSISRGFIRRFTMSGLTISFCPGRRSFCSAFRAWQRYAAEMASDTLVGETTADDPP